MCGIVGYIGNGNVYDILINGLKRLEYRGYDSAGIALVSESGDLNVYKTVGKVSNLENFCVGKNVDAKLGIAHTRWATHGEPCDNNAHPHFSEDGNLAIVHNGTIENYQLLKDALSEHGCKFYTETDTEVLVQLIEYIKNENKCELIDAVRSALKQVVGAYAIAVVEKNNPNQIIAARKSSPLVVGIGEDEVFLGSDGTPFVEYTKDVVYVKDEEIAIIRRGEPLKLVDFDNKESKVNVDRLQLSISQLEKGGYPHFMLKEIFEQPITLTDCIRGRVVNAGEHVMLNGVFSNIDKFKEVNRIIIVACGTSWHASLLGKSLIQDMCQIAVEVEYASEFRYSNPVITDKDIVIAVSQSGETADTLAAIDLAKANGAFAYGVCNVVGSSIARATHSGTYTHAGPEIGVASTKAFTTQVAVLTMIAATVGKELGRIDDAQYTALVDGLSEIGEKINKILAQAEKIEAMSKIFTYAKNFIYLGRDYNYPVALEGALKLKEISYIHAEGYPAAEMKHGPIALIDEEMPIVVIAPKYGIYEKILSNVQEVKARKGRIIAIVTEGDDKIKQLADYTIEIPEVIDSLSPLLTVIPLQLLSYYVAVAKGRDVDQPRNLAKSVTVE